MQKQHLYIFGWPSYLGGADTKLADLIELLYQDYNITIIPHFAHQLNDAHWVSYIKDRNSNICLLKDLPKKVPEGSIALTLCNKNFFVNKIHRQCIARGMKIIWSSEMMWLHEGEKEAIEMGEIDKLLVVSEIQKKKLNYESINKDIPVVETGNWINPDLFPYIERPDNRFNIGRVSRADVSKYTENFPQLYNFFVDGIPKAEKHILGWGADLQKKFSYFKFDKSWILHEAGSIPVQSVLADIDAWVYPLGHRFTESWGRSTIEAMLTGLIPIVDSGHSFDELLTHVGFKCKNYEEFKYFINWLYKNPKDRKELGYACHLFAKELMSREKHLQIWKEALS